MASSTDKTAAELRDALEAQVAEMRKEIATLSKSLSKKGSSLASTAEDTASEFYDAVREHGAHAAERVSQQARIVKDTAKENPIATLAVVAGISLLVGLIARK
ncbi:hypothetical protein ACLBWZ_15535 [Brucellaceae bacterium C25G]